MWEGGRRGHVSSRSTKLRSLDPDFVWQLVLHPILEKGSRKVRAPETFLVAARCILAKKFEGWEVMTVCAGGIEKSDRFFTVGGMSRFRPVAGLT